MHAKLALCGSSSMYDCHVFALMQVKSSINEIERSTDSIHDCARDFAKPSNSRLAPMNGFGLGLESRSLLRNYQAAIAERCDPKGKLMDDDFEKLGMKFDAEKTG